MGEKVKFEVMERELDLDMCNIPPSGWFLALSFALLFMFTFLVMFAMGFQICIIGVAVGLFLLFAYILKAGECFCLKRKSKK